MYLVLVMIQMKYNLKGAGPFLLVLHKLL